MKRVLLIISLLVLSVLSAGAQEIIVMGKVVSTVDDEPLSGVVIYAFKTVGAAEYEYKRAMDAFDSEMDYYPEGGFIDYRSMADGSYDFVAQANGALLFHHSPFKPVLVKIKGRNQIPVVKIEATTVLDEATLLEEGKKKTKKGKPVAHGNTYEIEDYYYFDEEKMGEVNGVGKTNARLISQVYLTNSDGSDTLRYFTPRVYDGEQFHSTQYHWRNDYLYELADSLPRLTDDRDTIQFNVRFEVEDPLDLYFVKANIWIEDYIKTYYQDSVTLFNTGRVSRPFQFLEYSFDQCHVDPQDYYKSPKREQVSTPKDMKLQFLIGKADLDRSDPETMAALESLKNELRTICSDPSYTLTDLTFQGYSSPDGGFAKNQALSDARTQTVFNEVWSVIPRSWQARIFKEVKGYVAPWTAVADTLEKHSMLTEAEEIRAIVAQYPDDMDKQGAQMKRLPYYTSKVVPVLPSLRSVKCEHKSVVFRFLSKEEILSKYENDPDFRNGIKPFTLNEYWELFQLVEDEKELETLYNRARVAAIRTEGKNNPWALPANHLAVQYLKRKQVDTLLLAPFIDERFRANYSLTELSGEKKILNDDAIVANQVQMLMLSKDYERAEELSSIIENEHPMLRAIVRCLGGYIDFEDPKEEATVELIKKSSPRNEVIINLYREQYDSTTVAALNKLPQNDPVTSYLRAQYLCLKYDNDVVKMKADEFARAEDPAFRHPDDEVLEAATPEAIEEFKAKMKEIETYIEEDKILNFDTTENEAKLADMKETLAVMEKGEETVIPVEHCSVYDAAKVYLQQCFAFDQKYVRTAQADYDISEDLLNDVLGIKKDKK